MSNLIEELQRGALDPNAPVSGLLRRAKVVASKLDLSDLSVWIENELNGYGSNELPAYRAFSGELKAFNPFRGWIPVVIEDVDLSNLLTAANISQSVGEIEQLAKANPDTLKIMLSSQFKAYVMNLLDQSMEPKLEIRGTAITSILDSVRNIILDWSLSLEKSGITGQGLSFSDKEKEIAHASSNVYNIGSIGNVSGNVGSVSEGSSVNVSLNTSDNISGLIKLLKIIKSEHEKFGLPSTESEQLLDSTVRAEQQLSTKDAKVSSATSFLSTIRGLLQSASANLLAKGVLYELGKHHW